MYTAVFPTALGEFGIGWTDNGISRLLLPDDRSDRVAPHIHGEASEPSAAIFNAIGMIQRYAEGECVSFAALELDLTGVPEFHRRAYALLAEVGYGETTTYGALARRMGDLSLARAVGQAMGANPVPLILPCHRVLGADGVLGGFSAPGGSDSKRSLLLLEGARTSAAPASQLALDF